MPVVAIAGASGSVGRFIVEETIADGNFEVIILGRKANLSLEKELGARILPIDYSNPDGITSLLEDNHVDVVIAAMTTKRYIPSVWGVKYRPEHSWFFNPAAKLSLFDALEKTDLEWTAVANVFFLHYWDAPNLKTYLDPLTIVLDILARKAAILGNPNQPVVFTYTRYVAKFTAKLLTLEKWEPVSYIVGVRLASNEFTGLAEEVLDTPETRDKARFYRDALLKTLYEQLFKIPVSATDSSGPRAEFLPTFQVLLISPIICTYRGVETFPSPLFHSKPVWQLFQSMGVYDQKAIDDRNSNPMIRECYQR
ncbi:isoflavone reductase like P3, partial [Fusarium globosum]